MTHIISSSLNASHAYIDADFTADKAEKRLAAQQLGLTALGLLITNVALTTIGVTTPSNLAVVVGLPLSFLSYNAYKICDNLIDIIDNPYKYYQCGGLISHFDKYKIKKQLSKGTLCFDLAIEALMEHMPNEKHQHIFSKLSENS